MISEAARARIADHLSCLYSADLAVRVAGRLIEKLERVMQDSRLRLDERSRPPLSEKTAVLITYGDQVREPGESPLHTLGHLADATLRGLITDIHVLPFFPYSSDDGFSVIDYESVDPALGDWNDIHRLAERFGLMVDLVINHVSSKSRWFQGFLRGEPEFADYFISVGDDVDLSDVVRPRALPLLTEVETSTGRKNVWTTFSSDQIDINYANPEVLIRMIDILLSYVRHGATLIRLDAVAYLWKRIGSSCIHCEETHRVVRLLRLVLDLVAPDVLLITETNVPHEENIRYFGSGTDEAQLVYQFPLPPLIVDAFLREDATALQQWAVGLCPPPGRATFFNFLASHDGIGLRPLEGLVAPEQVEAIVEQTIRHGGRVSYKSDRDGRKSAYELNISFFDALSDPQGREPLDLQVRRFLTAQAIMLGLAGVPGIYFHSLFGSRSWTAGVSQRGENRAINREKLEERRLLAELGDPHSLRSKAFGGYRELLRVRGGMPAFHPRASQRFLTLDDRVFAILRDEESSDRVLCLHNVSRDTLTISVRPEEVGFLSDRDVYDLFGAAVRSGEAGTAQVNLGAYGTAWLTERTE